MSIASASGANQFSKPPMGQVRHARLAPKIKNWVNSVEECIGLSALSAFLVATPQDMDKLRKLSKECGIPNLSISMRQFQKVVDDIKFPRRKSRNHQVTTVNSVVLAVMMWFSTISWILRK